MTQGQPVVAERSPVLSGTTADSYLVRQGDTLYSIAWRYELDFRGLARANSIRAPYTIYPGQRLRLITQLPKSTRVRGGKDPAPAVAPASTTERKLQWVWPLRLTPTQEFGGESKGLDFRLASTSDTVRAVAPGEVVYAGSGIGGFERLVIIKHSGSLLSAYSFDGRLQVREQERLQAGSALADIRPRGPTQQALHFELRRDGKPVDPRRYLP
jgi:lipoprotein NlpD